MSGSITHDLTTRLTDVADLTAVANAIRSKGGTTDPLVYPDGFVTAINNIQAGSGSIDIKVNELTPDCYFCDKDNHTAYLDFSNVITGKYFSFCIASYGSGFDPDDIDTEYDNVPCLICGIYTGDDSDTSPDCVCMKSNSRSGFNGAGLPLMKMIYDPITKRIDISYSFEVAKFDGMLSVIDQIPLSYVMNWN